MSTLRFSGLSSGLDTESIVKAIMTPYQSKIDKIKGKQTTGEWKKEAYKELSLKLTNFRTKTVSKLKSSATYNKVKATVSNTGAIAVNTNAATKNGNYSVKVEQLATKAAVSTSTVTSVDGSKLTKDSSVQDISGITADSKLKINGTEFSFTTADGDYKKISDLEAEVKAAFTTDGKTSIDFKFDESSQVFIINSHDTGKDAVIRLDADSLNTMNALGISTLNLSEASAGTVERFLGDTKLSELDGLGADQLAAKGVFKDGTTGDYYLNHFTYAGTDAKIVYNNGVHITSSTNEIEVDGLKFTAQAVTSEPVSIGITKDVEEMITSIKSFVDEYNSLIEEMSTKLYADSANKYSPLTDDEKEAMTDKEVENWENKIKSALFRNNDTLRDLYGMFRSTVTGSYKGEDCVEDEMSILASIGIGSSNWSEKGKLTIKEQELRDAIEKDPDAVSSLLTKIGEKLDKELNDRSKSTDLRSYGQFFSDKIVTQDLSQYAKDLITAQAKFNSLETMYYKKFSAMETAMNKVNSQSSLFSSL